MRTRKHQDTKNKERTTWKETKNWMNYCSLCECDPVSTGSTSVGLSHSMDGYFSNPNEQKCFLVWFGFCFVWNSFRSIIFLLVFILSKLFCILSYVFFMFLYVFIAVYVFFLWCVQNLLACACQKRALDPLESELGLLWVTMWVLGTETRSCPWATSTLNCWAIFSIPFVMFLTFHFWELSWCSYSKS